MHLLAICLLILGLSLNSGPVAAENDWREGNRVEFIAPDKLPPSVDVIEFLGKVVYVPLETGFYGIVSDTGKKYQPINLPEAFRQDELRVRVTARLVTNRLGLHMWGRYIEIIDIVPTSCLAEGELNLACTLRAYPKPPLEEK